MSRKIARITQEKKLLLANEVVEDNTKIRLDSDGRLEVDEIIEYPAELEGGRNLVKKSDKFRAGVCANGITASITSEGYLQIVTTSGNGNWHTSWFMDLTGIEEQFKEGDDFVISFTIKSPNSTAKPTIYLKQGMGYYPMQGTISTEFSQIYYTGKWKKANTLQPHLGWSGTAGTYIIKNWKIEKGDKATPWTPAPEDLGLNYPDSIQNFNSSISGNNIIVPEFIEGYPFVKPVIDDSLVLWLDGSTGNNYEQTGIWKDLSGNGNDGQLVNFGYTEDSGWSDGGLNFDGVDDYVRVPNVLNMDGDFTVEIWAESDVYNTARALFNTNARATSPWEDKGFFITNIYNPQYLYLGIKDGINGYVIQDINNVSTFNNSHIVVKREGNMLYSFFNYARQNSLDISSYESFKTDNDITIARGYKGKVKVVRIYDRALSNEEILQNYRAGQCSPLLAMRGDV